MGHAAKLVVAPVQIAAHAVFRAAPEQQAAVGQRGIEEAVEPLAFRSTADVRPDLVAPGDGRVKRGLVVLVAVGDGHHDVHAAAHLRGLDGLDDAHARQIPAHDVRGEHELHAAGLQHGVRFVMYVRLVHDVKEHAVHPAVPRQEVGEGLHLAAQQLVALVGINGDGRVGAALEVSGEHVLRAVRAVAVEDDAAGLERVKALLKEDADDRSHVLKVKPVRLFGPALGEVFVHPQQEDLLVHAAHGAGVCAHDILEFLRAQRHAVHLLHRPDAEPVGRFKQILVKRDRIDDERHAADVGFPAGTQGQLKRVLARGRVRLRREREVRARAAVPGRDAEAVQRAQAVVHAEGRAADGILRAALREDDHRAALILAIACVVLDRHIEKLVQRRVKAVAGNGNAGAAGGAGKHDLHAGFAVLRGNHAQRRRQRRKRRIGEEKFLFCAEHAEHGENLLIAEMRELSLL